MSRRPKPTILKLVAGNPGKRTVNKREPKPRRKLPTAPAHLSTKAKAAWKRVSLLLDRMGVLTEADGLALERLCECYAEILDYRDLVNEHGASYSTTSTVGSATLKANPAVAMLADADRRFRSRLIEFGLTPAARARVSRVGDDDELDPLDEFFR